MGEILNIMIRVNKEWNKLLSGNINSNPSMNNNSENNTSNYVSSTLMKLYTLLSGNINSNRNNNDNNNNNTSDYISSILNRLYNRNVLEIPYETEMIPPVLCSYIHSLRVWNNKGWRCSKLRKIISQFKQLKELSCTIVSPNTREKLAFFEQLQHLQRVNVGLDDCWDSARIEALFKSIGKI